MTRQDSAFSQIANGDDDKQSLASLRLLLAEARRQQQVESMIEALRKVLFYDFNQTELALLLGCIKGSDEELAILKDVATSETFFACEQGVVMLCERLLALDRAQSSYAVVLRVAEQWHAQRLHNQVSDEAVIQLELLLVAYEYRQASYKVARNRMRHLLSAPMSLTSCAQDVAYWSILLDVLDVFITHHQYKQIVSNCPVEYSTFFYAYRYLIQGKIDSVLHQALQQTDFEDGALNQKAACFSLLLTYVLGEPIAFSELQQRYAQYGHDVYFQLVMVNVSAPVYDHLWDRLLAEHGDIAAVLKAYTVAHPVKSAAKLAQLHVQFLGGGERIGGTSMVLTYKGQRLLLDAGMYLDQEQFVLDVAPLLADGCTLSELDGVVVSHAHLDHTGSLPYIKKCAPRVPMYMTPQTARIFGDLIRTVLHRSKLSYFTAYDLIRTEQDVLQQPFNESFVVAGAAGLPWKVTFYEAGHVIGAAAIHIEIDGLSILFTGDCTLEEQRHCGKLTLPPFLQVDLLITESTYGYRPKFAMLSKEAREHVLIDSLEKTVRRGGSFLIPAFSFGRAQEVLEIIAHHYAAQHSLPFNLIVDGHVVNMTKTYNALKADGKDLLNRAVMASAHYTDEASFQQFYDMYVRDGGAVIVASSGMLHKGSASYQYAQKMLPKPQHTIALTGYVDGKSPAAAIYNKRYAKGEAVLFGDGYVLIEADIDLYHFSAHVLQHDAVRFILDVAPGHVILMHGEHEKHYNPYNTSEAQANRLYLSIDRMLQQLNIPYTLAKNGQKYNFGG